MQQSTFSSKTNVCEGWMIRIIAEEPRFWTVIFSLCPQAWMIFFQYSARTSWVHWSIVFSPPLKKSIVFLKYALKMDLVKGEWFDLYCRSQVNAYILPIYLDPKTSSLLAVLVQTVTGYPTYTEKYILNTYRHSIYWTWHFSQKCI